MSDEAVKRRRLRAVRFAAQLLERSGYHVIRLRHPIFDLEAERRGDVRKIRICLNRAVDSDIRAAEGHSFHMDCHKEIWVRKEKSCRDFEIIALP